MPKEEVYQFSEEETATRRDEVIRRMANTPRRGRESVALALYLVTKKRQDQLIGRHRSVAP